MDFRYGRKDCGSEDFSDDHGRLPSAVKNYAHIFDVFGTRMGFSDREIVALLGAHTLGKCDPQNSGFDGPWTLASSPAKFDTGYYLGLLVPWEKMKNDFTEYGMGITEQWQQNTYGLDVPVAQMFLTADMDLLFENADNENCTTSTFEIDPAYVPQDKDIDIPMIPQDKDCILNTKTYDTVKEFSEDTLAFFMEFKSAFQKLQEVGYAPGSLLPPGECFSGANQDYKSEDDLCPKDSNMDSSSFPSILCHRSNFVWIAIIFFIAKL